MEQVQFEIVYKQYYQMIYLFVKKRVVMQQVAEDLTSEIFEKVYTSFSNYDADRCSIQTWLFVITNNHLKNYYRDKKEYIAFDDVMENTLRSEESVESILELKERQAVLKEVIKQLPERDMQIILYRYYMDMSAVDIGKKLNMTSGNVRISLKRALEKLRKMLMTQTDAYFPKRVCKYCGSPVKSVGTGSGFYRCTSPRCPFRQKYGDLTPMEDCDVKIK